MADVIPLAPLRRPRKSPGEGLAGASAEILFFTGVRYERPSEEPPARRPVKARRVVSKPGCAKRRRREA
ncbi:MAG: hypothetical protein DI527_06515 [Chelatococcus sp.]|nr:MAG: hypothetical protein DI527_06515 [Chelatococcus sp.]